MKKIILESLTEPGQILETDQFPVLIGRAPDNHLVIRSGKLFEGRPTRAFISRYHATINQEEGNYVLTDLKSTNGTYVNNERINQKILKSGDNIGISNAYQMVFRVEDSETSSQP